MKQFQPDPLRDRLLLDYEVCHEMFQSGLFIGEAYKTDSDLKAQRNPIRSISDGFRALHYRVDFHVRTLFAPGHFSEVTTIGFNLDVPNYPIAEPHTWLISYPRPYSPHFNGTTVCIDNIWKDRDGYMLLGELLVDIARLLNWDSPASRGYLGQWNPAAAEYYYRTYGNVPITPNMLYPLLPIHLLQGSNLPSIDKEEEPDFLHIETIESEPYPYTTVPSELFNGREEEWYG